MTNGVRPTSKRFAPFLLFNVSFWPVLNGWFGIWIALVGIGVLSTISPTTLSTLIAPPDVVPTPTDWGALKYIISFVSESNFFVWTGILIWLFNISIFDPRVCAIPVCLCTLITFLNGYTFKTLNNSISLALLTLPEPTLNEPPIETEFGICVTNISWIKPPAEPIVIAFASPILLVVTPILNESVRLTIELLNPDIETASLSFNSMNGK